MTAINPAVALGRRGGKARAAKLTPEQRSAIARKGGEAATLARGQRLKKAVGPAVARQLGFSDPGQPPKAKRPLPKPGTMNACALEALRGLDSPATHARIHAWMYERAMFPDRLQLAKGDDARLDALRNALSSLRTAGHVISVPHPTSKRERLWRLA